MTAKELRDELNDIIKNHGDDIEVIYQNQRLGNCPINQAYYHGDNKVILKYINFSQIFH